MKILWIHSGKQTDITELVSSVIWGGSARQASRTLEIAVAYSPYDSNLARPNIELGDRLQLIDDTERLLIDAMVYTRSRPSEAGTVTYSGYDELNRMLRSNGSFNFKNTTPEAITRTLCNQLKIEQGNIAESNVNIASLLVDSESFYDIMMKAYTKAYRATGVKFMPIMSGRKLSVIEKGTLISSFTLEEGRNISGSNYEESLEDMVNRIVITDDSGKIIGEVSETAWQSLYGIFQDVYTKESGINPYTAAKALLTGIRQTASLEALGKEECISGYSVKVKDSITGLTGIFWIENDTHTWENNIHTMSLELTFENLMDTREDD